ncbi:site-specific recombinase XerD [Catenuloplanes nepalensis]|uniref:Site-specific recombinase XerD n=1 Tax=Catenuloplanes nepalensis TaxID=587533 RepID=A0ABT9N5B9_9ACTN|nr:site-specific integrase [Catenuloplanes nepalensis]MDP9798910.1 site-specific recombinase XerD [Catenuloplanes nepalensis]
MVRSDDPVLPVRVMDGAGVEVEPVSMFLRDLRGCDYSVETLRSYGLALLRWQRFLWAVEVGWERATRIEVRDFVLWLQQAPKPGRLSKARSGSVNVVTGKRYRGAGYAARTINHNLSVVKGFYDFHAHFGGGPVVNPVPRPRVADAAGRVHAHHNPMEPYRQHRRAPYRQKEPKQVPRAIPDGLFNDLFASMRSHRDRALLAFYISTGARASELLGVTGEYVDIGQQLIGVIRKGSRDLQWLPASPDAFVWLRLYQQQLRRRVEFRPGLPLWVTLRRPHGPLNYAAFRAVLQRANAVLGTNWSLHDLRHTAAHRMIDDPNLSLADVQWLLGHMQVTTTQRYLEPREEEVVAKFRAHHAAAAAQPSPPPIADGYRPEVMQALFGRNLP